MAGLVAMGQDDVVLKKEKNILHLVNLWDGLKDHQYVEVMLRHLQE